MFISLDSVVEAARRRLAAVTPEVAGYAVLLATRSLEPRPSRLSLEGVLLTDEGDVQIRPGQATSELGLEIDLRALLATLLELSPSPVPAISAVAERSPTGSVAAFSAELSAALIPINHAAARRALARVYRETVRARGLAVDMPEPAARLEEHPSGVDLTAAPPPVAPVSPVAAVREIDIEVDLEADPESVLSRSADQPPPPVEWVGATRRHASGANDRGPDQRSDVRELLRLFLCDTRSDERMRRTLRAMIELDDCASPSNSAMPGADRTLTVSH
jgi:hypothetical protein